MDPDQLASYSLIPYTVLKREFRILTTVVHTVQLLDEIR